MASFQPDEILSVKDCIAITDTTYEKVRAPHLNRTVVSQRY